MKTGFYEESALCLRADREKKLYTLFLVCAIAAFAAAAFILTFAVNYLFDMVALRKNGEIELLEFAVGIASYLGTILLIAGAGVGFWFLKNRFNLSYDYTFVEDELRVSKTVNGKKRKFLKCLKAAQILKLGKYADAGYARTTAGLDKKSIIRFTPNREPADGKEFYYVLYTESLGKRIYILEAREALMEQLILAAGREKWEGK